VDLTTPAVRTLRLSRPTIDPELIGEMSRALDDAEADPRCRVVLLASAPGEFCTGMNLVAAAGDSGPSDEAGDAVMAGEAGGEFFDLLTRLTRTPLVVVSTVDGTAAGGGVGLVAASDLVYATERASFALPEALWGLLPCCVLPFIARRTGFQRAYAMALTTQPVDAATAAGWGLVDEVAADLTVPVRRLAFRATRVDRATLSNLKRYAHELFPVGPEVRRHAVTELGRLLALPAVRERLSAFANHRRYPWEG
jgi:polyketide biosynthesis enoyl-CoA hydratase PksH